MEWPNIEELFNPLIRGVARFKESPVFSKTSGDGLKVDPETPTFPWRDLEGPLIPRTSGVGRATLAAYTAGGNVYGYHYAAGDLMELIIFHVPHDYLPGSDLYLHLHWSHNGTDISGDLDMSYYVTYAKGHNQANFAAEKTLTQSITIANITAMPTYRHRIDEVQLSAASPSASQLDSDDIEPDGLIMIGFVVDGIPTITGGAAEPFLHYLDIHYQTTNIGTKQKAPDFYT